MECKKPLIVMLILNTLLLIISLSTLACNSSQYKNFMDTSKYKAKDYKGLIDVATLYLLTSEKNERFIKNFKNYEIGFTVSIFLALIILFALSILLSCYKVDSEDSSLHHKDIVYLCYFFILSLTILFIAKLVIHSYVVHIYFNYTIENIGSFKAKNAGGLVISIFGLIFMIPIFVNLNDLSHSILYNYQLEQEKKQKIAKNIIKNIVENIQQTFRSENENEKVKENENENEWIRYF